MIVIVLPEDKSSFCNSELKNVPFNFRKDNTCISITQIEKEFGVILKKSYQYTRLKFSCLILTINIAISSIQVISKFGPFNL